MPLTGRLLIVVALCSTVMVLAATVWVWGRPWSLWFVLRPAGVLLIEALLLVSVGLVVNRQEGFYPSWTALFSADDTGTPSYRTVAGSLDGELAARAGARGALPQLLRWQPAGWADWRLASVPTMVIPAGYLQHPQWRYSVVLVVGEAGPGWPVTGQDAAELSVAADASRDVVLYVTTTPRTAMQTLTTDLPGDLRHDLRVTGHRWAVVTSQANAGLVQDAALATPGQYPAIATVQTGPPPPVPAKAPRPTPGTRTPVSVKHAGRKVSPAGVLARARHHDSANNRTRQGGLPVGIASLSIRSSPQPANVLTALATAVSWAATQTPPPLAASSPPVKYLPVHKHSRSHTTPGPRSPQHPSRAYGRTHGPGQPRH